MYVNELLTVMVQGMRAAFSEGQMPDTEFVGTYVTTEYPARSHAYPMVWVEYAPTGSLVAGGVGGHYFIDEEERPVTSWIFAGRVDFTIIAMGEGAMLVRNRLFDNVVKVLAFGSDFGNHGGFREYIDASPLIAIQPKYDQIEHGRFGTSPSSPWGTNEPTFEATATIEVLGEFYSDPAAHELVTLEDVRVLPAFVGTPDPASWDGGGWQ